MAERERLAAEIHDTLAQGFTSILMLLQAAEPRIGNDPGEARRQVGLAVRTARENLAEARALVAAVPPAALGDSSLDEAVRRLTDRLGEELDVDTECVVSGSPRRLEARSEVVLLRAAQEGLANVRKHAKATHVGIELDYGDTVVRLEIQRRRDRLRSGDGERFRPARHARTRRPGRRVHGRPQRARRGNLGHRGGAARDQDPAGRRPPGRTRRAARHARSPRTTSPWSPRPVGPPRRSPPYARTSPTSS